MDPDDRADEVDLYGAQYSNFATALYARVRAAAMGEDIGQNGWLTAEEQDRFIGWLGLGADDLLLDVACGSGGPTLRIAERTGCRVVGVDIHEEGIARARQYAAERAMADRASFRTADAAASLPFDDGAFSAIVCIDAVNHLPDRRAVFREWRRLLRPGGRLLFTDPIVVTGPLSNAEIATRSSIGFFLFVPRGASEALLREEGFDVRRIEDRTANMALIARRWHSARAAAAADLCRVEGEDAFAGQQKFLDVAATLAAEARLSRLAYFAVA